MPPVNPATVRVHIGTLRLPTGATGAADVGAALRAELGALLARGPLPASLTRPKGRARVDAGALPPGAYQRPDQMGRGLARLVADALAASPREPGRRHE